MKTFKELEKEFEELDQKLFMRLEKKHFIDKLHSGYFNLDNFDECIAEVTYLERASLKAMHIKAQVCALGEVTPEMAIFGGHLDRFKRTVDKMQADAIRVMQTDATRAFDAIVFTAFDEDEDDEEDEADDYEDYEDEEEDEGDDEYICCGAAETKEMSEKEKQFKEAVSAFAATLWGLLR